MSYSNLELNQTVSFNNLQSGVTQGYFVAKTTIPVSSKQITKTEADTYVNINTSLPSYSVKASNQLVVRSNLQGVTNVYPYTIYALADIGGIGDYYSWISIDGGNNFSMLAVYPSLTWTEIAGDVTGTYMAVVDNTINNQVYFSNNGGSMFSAVSLNGANFYPNGVSMSTSGQYIAISGFSGTADGINVLYPKIAISSNYGASFSTYTYGTSFPLEIASGKISVSGDGQYITAIFSYLEFVGFPFNYKRPVSFKLTSSNYGASWSASSGTTYARFLGIALSDTGQYQFLTSDWYDRNNVFPSSWVEGIKGYISNDYGANWTEKFQDYNNNSGTVTYRNLKFAGISSSGSSMVAATGPLLFSSDQIMRYASSDYGANFSTFTGVPSQQGLAVGQTPVSGITNSYAVLFTPNSTMYYSTDGGFTAWFPKTIANRFFRHIYNKALNTPSTTTTTTTAAPVVYTIDNAATGSSALACAGSTTTSTVYAQPGYTIPFVTMILYDSSALINPFIGSTGWRKLVGPVDTYAVEIDVNGEITNYVTC
jgi:hypothetical protein